jgi:hypothetical protein
MSALPYVTAPGNIERALTGIKSAATPPRVNQDFVKTILKIPGGSGAQMTSYLKKIGFANADGTPSDIYRRFRNPSTAGSAAADSIKFAYGPLYTRNEYMHQLSDEKLKGLIIEETGQGSDSNVVSLVLAAIKSLKKHANWDGASVEVKDTLPAAISSTSGDAEQGNGRSAVSSLGMDLSYTINLNLPATTDVAVFNAIFKSLKENLLKND